MTASPTEGATFSGAVATFTDADPAGVLTDYSATIAWGDGNSLTGTISGPGAGGVFTVSGSHSYADEASGLTLTVTINDVEGASATTGSSVKERPINNFGIWKGSSARRVMLALATCGIY